LKPALCAARRAWTSADRDRALVLDRFLRLVNHSPSMPWLLSMQLTAARSARSMRAPLALRRKARSLRERRGPASPCPCILEIRPLQRDVSERSDEGRGRVRREPVDRLGDVPAMCPGTQAGGTCPSQYRRSSAIAQPSNRAGKLTRLRTRRRSEPLRSRVRVSRARASSAPERVDAVDGGDLRSDASARSTFAGGQICRALGRRTAEPSSRSPRLRLPVRVRMADGS